MLAPGSTSNCVRMASGSVNRWGRGHRRAGLARSAATNDTTITGAGRSCARRRRVEQLNVTVSWTCSTMHRPAITSCGPSPVMLSADGHRPIRVRHRASTRPAHDVSTTGDGMKIDKTAPTRTGQASVGPERHQQLVHGQTTIIRWTCADALSGVKTPAPPSLPINRVRACCSPPRAP